MNWRVIPPNVVSLLNVFFGFFSILSSIQGHYDIAAIYILAALFFDGFDGRIARKLGSVSTFGAELDSLSDLTSFGVAPGVLLYMKYFYVLPYGAYIAVLLPLAVAIGLANFNIEFSGDYFEGLVRPVGGGLVAAIVLSGIHLPIYALIGTFIVIPLLMIAPIKYPSFKHIPTWQAYVLFFFFLSCVLLSFVNTYFILVPFVGYILGGPFLQRIMFEHK